MKEYKKYMIFFLFFMIMISKAFASEINCLDEIDNDGDGYLDCTDHDCFGQIGCSTETGSTHGIEAVLCRDGEDNDLDGLIDCNDSDCIGIGNCGPPAAEICFDNIDNDLDGLIDCADILDCPDIFGCGGGGKRCCSGECIDLRGPPHCVNDLDCADFLGCTIDKCIFPDTCESYCEVINITHCDNEWADDCCPPDCTYVNDLDCPIVYECGNDVCDPEEDYSNCQDCCDSDGTGINDLICHSSCSGVSSGCDGVDLVSDPATNSTSNACSSVYGICNTNCNYVACEGTNTSCYCSDGICQECEPGYYCSSHSCELLPEDTTPICGDGNCNLNETKCACPEDCGECTGNATEICTEYTCINDTCSIINSTNCCGNDICETNETCSCVDCPCEQDYECVNEICQEIPYCGDGTCGDDEDCSSCPQDCICETNQVCKPERENTDSKGCYTITCGDTYCDTGEDNTNCCTDCSCPSGYNCTNNQCIEMEEEEEVPEEEPEEEPEEHEEIKPKKTIQVLTPSGVNVTVRPGESKHIEVKRENKRVNVSVSITQEIKEEDIEKVNLTVEKVIEHEQVKQISNIKNITLTKKQDKSVYEIQGENDENFLFLIPVKTKETIDIDSNTGQVVKRIKQDTISAFFTQYIVEPIGKFFSALFGGNK